jgi:uncharacterized membrane protein
LKKSDNIKIVRITVHLFLLFIFIAIPVASLHPKAAFSHFIFQICSKICHQGGKLTIIGWEVYSPLCPRCTGMYLSLWIGAILYEFGFRKKNKKIAPTWLLWGTSPLIIDGLFNLSQKLNLLFLPPITGILFGFSCGLFIMQGIDSYKNPTNQTKSLNTK